VSKKIMSQEDDDMAEDRFLLCGGAGSQAGAGNGDIYREVRN
jgi:hypothetical protein